MNLAEKVYKFLIPQYAVAEVFLVSLLYVINFWLNVTFEQYPSFFSPFLVIAAGYAGYSSFKIMFLNRENKNSNELIIIQVIGLVLILNITLLYIYDLFFKLNLDNLTLVNYYFLVYSAIISIRFILLVGAFTFGNKVSLAFLLLPPKAKVYLIRPILFVAVLIISLLFYFRDLSDLRIATAEAFFIGALCLDIIQLFKRRKSD